MKTAHPQAGDATWWDDEPQTFFVSLPQSPLSWKKHLHTNSTHPHSCCCLRQMAPAKIITTIRRSSWKSAHFRGSVKRPSNKSVYVCVCLCSTTLVIIMNTSLCSIIPVLMGRRFSTDSKRERGRERENEEEHERVVSFQQNLCTGWRKIGDACSINSSVHKWCRPCGSFPGPEPKKLVSVRRSSRA